MNDDFDPMQMMGQLLGAGTRFHSVFIAPLSPSLVSARTRFLADGSGPLADIVPTLARQGVADPAQAARTMVAAAQGMCVAVIAHERAASGVPQFFFGSLDAATRQGMVQALGTMPGVEGLAGGLEELAGWLPVVRWPELVSGPARHAAEDLTGYWLELCAAVVEGLDDGLGSLVGGGRDRMADLAWWASQGVLSSLGGRAIDPGDLELVVRCQLLAGDAQAAGQGIDVLVRSGEVDADGVVDLLHAFVDGALAAGQARQASTWLEQAYPTWDQALGGSYDLALAAFRLAVAAGGGGSVLVPAAERVMAADRKAGRGDLTREPLWAVHQPEGELLDTAAAADLLCRSTTFVVKRLEAGTIPWSEQDGSRRLPRISLLGWKAVMERFALLQ